MLLSSVNHLFLWSISHGYVKQPEGNSDQFITSFIFFVTPFTVSGWWLLLTPLNNTIWSVGIMKFPAEWKNTIHVPNHQPVILILYYSH